MKIGLIGYGYWGKIVFDNLQNMGCDVEVCDPLLSLGKKNYKDLAVDKAFVLTPVDSHYEICEHFLDKGVDVFCEKPLASTADQASRLYRKAKSKGAGLFVDWIFTFNDQVNLIKDIIFSGKYGKLKSVSMNRLNLGPAREDVTAKYDLACHDVSIVIHILGKSPRKVHWLGYSRNKKSVQNDSCFGFLDVSGVPVQINCSWHYGRKDRSCVFEFDKGFLHWEDAEKILEINNKNLWKDGQSPLENSINAFLTGDYDQARQKKLTLATLKALEHENSL